MIIEIWVILLALSLILIILGKVTDAPPLQIGAYGFVFILGLILMLGALEYKIGEDTLANYTYVNNTISYINESQRNIYGSYENEIIQGITINHTIGFFMCVLSILGFISVMDNLGRLKNKREAEE